MNFFMACGLRQGDLLSFFIVDDILRLLDWKNFVGFTWVKMKLLKLYIFNLQMIH